ncbi:hypothetical protein HETIRDRAFT_164306 [Heterobasidion irregulare TC 32-1]|uniref:Uncharacterized protein n=1 Tax=Heterobasidion irregulare (strain TC 32-1) TaxID=747525 RepID=W4JPR7_HETIT|nr:uncharacterized protein HETIRDRAFT_164306 [Heterobasidion irregulare TC 32-1]ETW75567.1 hypothetical protein HETIRDRAFT_164306 [Heterobasidion irregulare TC 32-1]
MGSCEIPHTEDTPSGELSEEFQVTFFTPPKCSILYIACWRIVAVSISSAVVGRGEQGYSDLRLVYVRWLDNLSPTASNMPLAQWLCSAKSYSG